MKTRLSIQKSLFGFLPPKWLEIGESRSSGVSGKTRVRGKILLFFPLVLSWMFVGMGNLLAQSKQTFTTPGTIQWTAPAGTYEVQIECWGGGGGVAFQTRFGGNGGNYTRTLKLSKPAIPQFNFTITVGGMGQESRVEGDQVSIYASGGLNNGAVQVADPFTSITEASFAGGKGGVGSEFPNTCNGPRSGGSGGGGAGPLGAGGNGNTSSGCNVVAGGNGGNGDGTGNGGNNNTGTSGQNGIAPGGGGGASITGSLNATGQGAPGQVRITYWCNLISPGIIGNAHTIVNPQELVPDFVTSIQGALVIHGTPTYIWEEKSTTGSTWNPVATNGTGESYAIPNLTQPMVYRRSVQVCNLPTEYSNEVTINVLPPNGTISGKVKSTNNVGVEGIEIRIQKKTSLPGSPRSFVYTSTTDAQGFYQIPVYYGDPGEGNNSTTFVIKPIKANHDFTPDSSERTVSSFNPNQIDVDFTDNTVYSITGKVFQTCVGCLNAAGQPANITSNLDGVTMLRKGVFVMKTGFLNPPGLYGQWASTVTDQGLYSFKPQLEGHRFVPDSFQVNVLSNVANVNFEDTTTRSISGKFGDGCNNFIGIAELEFSDVLVDKDGNERTTEFRKRIFTNNNGTYAVRLPARKYKVSVVSFTPGASSEPVEELDLLAFFNDGPSPSSISKDSLITDITFENQLLNLRFQRKPSIQLIGFDKSFCNGTELPFVTLEQSTRKRMEVRVFQGSPGLGCPLSDDTVRIVTNLAGDDLTSSYKIRSVNGLALDSFIVGSPNTLGNFLKILQIAYTDGYGRQANPIGPDQVKVVVLGVKSDNSSSFATTSPQIPLVVLHDPPGDQSYSFWETNKTIERAMRWSAASGNSTEGWLNVKVGAQFEAGLGVTTETQIWGSINSSVSVNSRTNRAEESIISTTTTQNISTSSDEDVTGDDGDLFIGAAMNLLYSRSTQVQLNENCQVIAPKRLMIAQNGFATQYVYTAAAIKQNVIPTLQNFVNNPGSSEAEIRNYQNQIKVWEQVLANNEINKNRSALDKNISFFGSSGAISNTTTSTTTKSNTIEFDMEIDQALAFELGFEIAGSGVSGGVNVHMKTEMGNSTTNTTTNSTTIGYTLDDNDALDNFSVNVRKDPVYNTPVFQTVAGQSSCPPEANTQPRDEIQLLASNPVLTNVPANTDAIFELNLGNLSIDPNPRTYNLSFEQASNPFGATIRIGGSVVTGTAIPYTIDQYDEVPVTVNVSRNPANNAFTYEGLKFTLSDACSGEVNKSVLLSASFAVNCSPITMTQPEAGWLCNQMSNHVIPVVVKDYVLANLTQIQLEYAKGGSNNWRTGFTRLASALSSSANGTTINWNVSSLADGEYFLRIKLTCSGGITYTQRIQGTIDRKSPSILGTPQPTDGIFSLGDEISFQFDEDIRTSDLNNGKAELRRISDNLLIPTQVNGLGSKLIVSPVTSLQAFAGDRLRLTLKNIEDKNGNTNSTSDTLLFDVEGFEPGTGNRAVQLTVNQPSIIENALDTLLFAFELPQNASEEVQVNFTMAGIASFPNDYSVSFSNSNGLNSFNGVQGKIIIPQNKKSAVLRIHPKADGEVESSEEVTISIAQGGDYQIGSNFSATGTIIDNSIAAPTISGSSQFCPGTTTILTANHPQAGNPGYTFLWSNGASGQSVTVSQAGNYSVIITETATGMAGTSQLFVLTNFALPNTNAGADFSLTQNSGNFPLGGSPNGGTWSGIGVTGSTFNSNQALGAYALVYCFTSAEGCTRCDTVLVTLTAIPLPTIATPTFAPGAGTFNSPVSVTLSCPTVGAQIYYTTTGNTPVVGTGFTLLYQGPIQVNQTTNIKAMGVLAGAPNSAVVSGIFTINNQSVVATPVISPATGTYSGSKLVTISTTTSGAEIYYTTSGNLPVIGTSFTKLYTGSFWLTASATVRAIGVKSGMTNSAIAASFITITTPGGIVPEPVSISPEPGNFQQAQTVVLSYGDPTVTLYYTLDGSEPDPNSPNTFVYTGPFLIGNSATVIAIAMKNGVLQGLLDPAVFTIGVVTSTVENQKVAEVLVYPNPSSTGVYQIKVANGTFDPIHYQVTTLDGKLVVETDLEPTQTEINLGHLSSGIYLLKVQQKDRITIHRLVRQ